MPEVTDDCSAALIRDLALEAAPPNRLQPGAVYGWLSGGTVHKIDLTTDAYRDRPRFKRGTVTVRNVDSFAAYYEKHSDAGSEVYADLDAATFTAVLDAHEGLGGGDSDGARWQQHRLILALQATLPWQTWLSRDRQWMSQQQFAEFVEDNARDVAPDGSVTAADLLEIAQSFQANTKVKFTAGKRLATGQTQLTYIEEVEAKAGNRGDIVIPAEFQLGIIPYDDCPPLRLAARFRYRIDGGDLRMAYFLADPARAAREAVAVIAEKVADATSATVMHGTPA
jgi:uncharacterized protein YfdQ (DUF2303 family)